MTGHTEDDAERTLDLLLNRPLTRLARPAGKTAPVVLDDELRGQTSSSSTISVESERRGPSFRIRV